MDPWFFAGLFFLTFLSEDAAVLSGALLASTDGMEVVPAFLACFLGIWAGDVGLYGLARFFGRPILSKFGGEAMGERIARSEEWFRRRGVWTLVLCRVVPGTRVPTYLTAGFLRMPAVLFAGATGVLAVVWVALVFQVVGQFGKAAPEVLEVVRTNAAWVGAGLVLLSLVVFLRERLFLSLRRIPFVERLVRWEFWPAGIFYLPVGAWYLWLAVRYRGLGLPTCANPGMFTGGLIGESKYATLRDLMETSPEWTAASFLLEVEDGREGRLERLVAEGRLEYPFVLKPDVGQRGSGFKIVRSPSDARAYLSAVPLSVVAQAYLRGPNEAGIFYYRFPDEPVGHILAITEKIFPEIVGDGERSVRELICADDRAAMISQAYLRRFSGELGRVLGKGESLRLVEAGNHAQGCIFRDGMRYWSEALEARVDEISRKVPGFFVGRYDVRFESWEELRAGRGFSILELNGAASEATSAYDASKSLVEAYRLLFHQWKLVFAIGAENRRRGCRPERLTRLFAEWRHYQGASLCHPVAD